MSKLHLDWRVFCQAQVSVLFSYVWRQLHPAC